MLKHMYQYQEYNASVVSFITSEKPKFLERLGNIPIEFTIEKGMYTYAVIKTDYEMVTQLDQVELHKATMLLNDVQDIIEEFKLRD